MENNDLIKKVYETSDKYNVILKGNIKIKGDLNCILFAHYCKSTLFYKDFLMFLVIPSKSTELQIET
ncbi:hypothetical protein Curi_c05300 [Gottschalkia acidurici 9a]|uniref:Uncharacterized protein n=1 Tax=Gottschalkia acidurici (strain ATCC 7906 / DSM 604 / BCRC 14475 / CIP 104303 / KCTC 5404 / NCIMB 10678 / 9a) TaxID=1128398 RepID=K0AXY2_GOTA9|nr:hypothetical protein [Gottschalkia acidurici]AFS77605.1 hypothetical protein Curi_c05300 [Gottschalkia acidurici 9a]